MNKQFNYREVGTKEQVLTLREGVLATRGLKEEDVELLKNTPKEYSESWRNLNNIEEGVDLYLEAVRNYWRIYLLVDTDADGMTSSTEFYRYTKRINPDLDIHILQHNGKQHGLSDDIEVPKDAHLLVILDAGTNDIEREKELVNRGTKILVIDHHKIEQGWEEIEGVILINNQNSDRYKNKSISGSGLTSKFLQAVDSRLKTNYAEDYFDLAGLGCVADIMSSTELDTRYLMNFSANMETIKNPFMKLVIENKILNFGKLNLSSVAWNLAPVINSVTRVGTLEDRNALFNALISDDKEVVEYGYTRAISCKGKQDRAKKKGYKMCKDYIQDNQLDRLPIMLIDTTNLYSDNGLNGAIANMLSAEYNRPVIVFGGREEVLRGSCRNVNEVMIKDFNKWCTETGLFNLVGGHASAFGVEIPRCNVEKIIQMGIDEFGDSFATDKIYEVERVIPFSQLKEQDVVAIGELEDIWCTNIKEPMFLIKGVRINSAKLEKKGARGNVLLFKVGNFSFIKMFLSNDFYNRVTLKDKKTFGSVDLKMDILCNFKKNEWCGNITPQLEIVDIYSREDTLDIDDLF